MNYEILNSTFALITPEKPSSVWYFAVHILYFVVRRLEIFLYEGFMVLFWHLLCKKTPSKFCHSCENLYLCTVEPVVWIYVQ